jgi:hypothetical protein
MVGHVVGNLSEGYQFILLGPRKMLGERHLSSSGMVAVASSAICCALRDGPRQLITNVVVKLNHRVFVPARVRMDCVNTIGVLVDISPPKV